MKRGGRYFFFRMSGEDSQPKLMLRNGAADGNGSARFCP